MHELKPEATPQGRIALAHNYEQLSGVRHLSAILTGVLVGRLGVTSVMEGVLIFGFLSAVLVPLSFLATLKLKGYNYSKCFPSMMILVNPGGLLTGIASFTLTWTLVYNMYWIYDLRF